MPPGEREQRDNTSINAIVHGKPGADILDLLAGIYKPRLRDIYQKAFYRMHGVGSETMANAAAKEMWCARAAFRKRRCHSHYMTLQYNEHMGTGQSRGANPGAAADSQAAGDPQSSSTTSAPIEPATSMTSASMRPATIKRKALTGE